MVHVMGCPRARLRQRLLMLLDKTRSELLPRGTSSCWCELRREFFELSGTSLVHTIWHPMSKHAADPTAPICAVGESVGTVPESA